MKTKYYVQSVFVAKSVNLKKVFWGEKILLRKFIMIEWRYRGTAVYLYNP